MRSFLLATAATIALCANAVAADQGRSDMNRPMNQGMGGQSQMQQSEHPQNARAIDPSNLNQKQISLIQRELNDQGFNAGPVDGVWGAETRQAIHSFQKQRNLSTDQQLNRQTLSELGVSLNGDTSTTGAGTTGAGTGSSTTGSGAGSSDQPSNPPSSGSSH